ncbi:MAG TPA: NifU N-terminal domain-containing protein [Phycisphaerales bacterium]|nr:NifU N-terminal domain-containing protein [Phycisphaerales bacterium]
MPYAVSEYQTTPNPNALKCILDRPLRPGADALRSFRDSDQARNDPLGLALLAVPGVASVLLADSWLTVNKSPEARWPAVKAGVERALAAAE